MAKTSTQLRRALGAAILPALLVGALAHAQLKGDRPLYGPSAAEGEEAVELSSFDVEGISDTLAEGHRALRAFDLRKARAVGEAVEGLMGPVARSLAVRYYLARLAFYDGRYAEGLDRLGPPPAGQEEPDDVLWLRGMLTRQLAVARDFQVRETEHFRISYVPGPDEVLLPYLEDTLEKSYQAIGSELGHAPGEKVRLEIYPSSAAFISVSGLTREEIQTTGIIALCVYNKLMVTTPRALGNGYRWLDTASHEYIHQVVALSTDNTVPVWLQEGLAKFFEVRWRGGRAADLTPMSENLLAEALQTGNFVPFKKMSPSVAKLPSQEEAQLAFAQVETFIEMIVAEKGLEGIREMMAQMKAGRSDQEAVAAVMGRPFPSVENHWKTFVAKKRPRRLPGISLMPIILEAQALVDGDDTADKVTDPFMAQNKALREFTRLGDLLRDRNRFQAALIEYEKAEGAAQRESPALTVKIAKTHLMANNLEQAREVLEGLVTRYDQFGPAWTLLAKVRSQLGDKAGAIAAFEQANASNPFDPAIHVALADLYADAGETAKAEIEQQAVRILLGEG